MASAWTFEVGLVCWWDGSFVDALLVAGCGGFTAGGAFCS